MIGEMGMGSIDRGLCGRMFEVYEPWKLALTGGRSAGGQVGWEWGASRFRRTNGLDKCIMEESLEKLSVGRITVGIVIRSMRFMWAGDGRKECTMEGSVDWWSVGRRTGGQVGC